MPMPLRCYAADASALLLRCFMSPRFDYFIFSFFVTPMPLRYARVPKERYVVFPDVYAHIFAATAIMEARC